MNKKVNVQDLGLRDYKETWDYQEKLFQGIVQAHIFTKMMIQIVY